MNKDRKLIDQGTIPEFLWDDKPFSNLKHRCAITGFPIRYPVTYPASPGKCFEKTRAEKAIQDGEILDGITLPKDPKELLENNALLLIINTALNRHQEKIDLILQELQAKSIAPPQNLSSAAIREAPLVWDSFLEPSSPAAAASSAQSSSEPTLHELVEKVNIFARKIKQPEGKLKK